MFLDVDGTLLPLEETPDAVRADLAVSALIDRLSTGLRGAVALVSGRRIEDLERFFPGAAVPMIGLHGMVVRMPRKEPEVSMGGGHEAFRDAVASLKRYAASRRGVVAEDKEYSVALHYRQNPDARDECREAFEHALEKLAPHYVGIAGNMVFEIRPARHDKGSAIERLMREYPFRGRRPVFCGDDVTDEDGFEAVNRMGGISIKVGHGESGASYRLPGVEAVRAWLTGYAEFLERRPGGSTP